MGLWSRFVGKSVVESGFVVRKSVVKCCFVVRKSVVDGCFVVRKKCKANEKRVI